jgi:hypothetical protein
VSGPPPADLMDWPKAELVRELERLRAVMREHSEQLHDPARSGGDSVGGSPHGRGDSLLDTRGAVLLDYNEVILVDTKQVDVPSMAMILEGRVNYSAQRVKQMYLFGPDGAAGIVTQLFGLAARAGGRFAAEFATCVDQRSKEMP